LAQKGTLTVVLIGADTQKPMQGVVVIRTCGGTSEGKTTDAQGKAVFAIEAPDKIASQTPRSSQKPYCSVDLKIVANGYLTLTIVGEQVFADTSTLQRLEMIPYDGSKFEKVIITPPHKLYASQSSAKAPTGAVSAFSELKQPRPTVPETITVHLGAPGREAEDVTVPFIYYVKNVASSEIYPTWPTESLKANILCIVSLALNRIYTEWYRSQGYEYDITSSTAYDQSYVPDRSVFDNISELTDELFTQYLSREGSIEPLFAEYCDGATVVCDGLSQWGTVPLARRGYDAIEIVRYYYGRDVVINSANVAQPEPSFTGELKKGDDNSNVALLQYRLNRVAINFPSIPFVRYQNGEYGEDTELSVSAFQRIFGLPETGVADRKTWYRLLYVYNAVKKLAELGSEGEKEQGDGFGGRTLQLGDKGSEVLRMQYYLRGISDALGENAVPRATVTGVFDENTAAAVKAFQSYYGLTVTGNVPKETWDAIVETHYALGGEGGDDKIKKYPGSPVRRGNSGENVLYIQRALNAIRNNVPSIRRLDEDGVFGSETLGAVKEFQTFYGLNADGVVGPLTWEAINLEYQRSD